MTARVAPFYVLRYFLRVGTLRAQYSECVPSHSFTQYLASVEQYQQRVKEYATQRRYSDLMNVPKNVDAHLRRVNMNHQLDQTLLELYPNFGEAFNNLLRPEERFQLKKNELMNTPMRIFALIRLGIAHHDTIAEIFIKFQ